MLKIQIKKRQISFIALLVCTFILVFLITYLTPLSSFILTSLNKEASTIGQNLLIGLASSIIALIFPAITKLLKKGPIVVRLPHIIISRKYLSKKEIKEHFRLKTYDSYKLIRNGIILKGSNKYSTVTMPFVDSKPHLSVSAQMQALHKNNKSKYWRYGIEISNSNQNLILFHLDSEGFIVIAKENVLQLRYIEKDILSTRSNNIKIYASLENSLSFISIYLNNSLISQLKVDNVKPFSFSFKAWSDSYKDHYVKISKIKISSSS